MSRLTFLLVVVLGVLLALPLAIGYSQQAQPAGVLRLRVRVKADDTAPLRGLARKRFFLIPGTLEQNRALIEAMERQPLVTRDCYYSKHNASAALVEWLKAS